MHEEAPTSPPSNWVDAATSRSVFPQMLPQVGAGTGWEGTIDTAPNGTRLFDLDGAYGPLAPAIVRAATCPNGTCTHDYMPNGLWGRNYEIEQTLNTGTVSREREGCVGGGSSRG